MTGYPAEEVIGRNPKFLQGPDTDRRTTLLIRESVCEEKMFSVTLLNYTKQGRPFWIVFHMAPVFSQTDGRLMHFVGAQVPLSHFLFGLQKHAGKQQKESCRERQLLRGMHPQYCIKDHTKHMKGAATILELVLHELVLSSVRRNAGVLNSRCLSENAETASLTAICSSLTLALTRIQQSFVISSPNLVGTPIVYASDMFSRLTGYEKDEIIGCNCSFLHGEVTDMAIAQEIQDCIKSEMVCTARIISYRKDNVAFCNLLHVAPVRDHTGKVAYFVGVQLDLGSPEVGCSQAIGVTPRMEQLGAVGAVKVAVRSLQGSGLHRNLQHQ
uniref:Putative LOV domain-containing protein n=1 Tax=Lindsaea microphylla TaxID=641181 RepID=A0A126X438_9MONI|nr:putative LOV domain-containing protein [Lindsaea microphylla]